MATNTILNPLFENHLLLLRMIITQLYLMRNRPSLKVGELENMRRND